MEPLVGERLAREQCVWLATARPDGRPHLSPVWFAWIDERIWVCTGADVVKSRNARANPAVMLALEDASNPVLCEGTVVELHERPYPPQVVAAFGEKYAWDLTRTDDVDGPFDALWEIRVDRWLMQGSARPEDDPATSSS